MAYTTINKPSEYFNTKLYTGNGSTQSITGVGFQPDLSWFVNRNSPTRYNHSIHDSVRGSTKYIPPNTTNQELTDVNSVTSFDNDGFSIGSFVKINESGTNFVSWNWKANGSGSSNTDGSITSTVSANTTSGFSIVTYTGTGANATVGHGLGSAPKMMLIKHLNTTNHWRVYHNSLGATNVIYLNLTDATDTGQGSVNFNNTAPTSSVFSLGTNAGVNASGGTYVAYCFAEKKGFSKFGSYVGNGNADGTFIYTGFKPSLLIRKRTDASNDWYINDNKRAGYNPQNNYLFPNSTQIESALQRFDFLSNGFKIRTTDTGDNASGGTYIYMAFAENPLVGTNNIPATAR